MLQDHALERMTTYCYYWSFLEEKNISLPISQFQLWPSHSSYLPYSADLFYLFWSLHLCFITNAKMTNWKNTAGQLAILILSSLSKKLLHHHVFEQGRTHFALCRSGGLWWILLCEQLYWIQCRSIVIDNGQWTWIKVV